MNNFVYRQKYQTPSLTCIVKYSSMVNIIQLRGNNSTILSMTSFTHIYVGFGQFTGFLQYELMEVRMEAINRSINSDSDGFFVHFVEKHG